MRGLAMLGLDQIGYIEKEIPTIGPNDALVKPLALAPCTSDVHTVWEHALGEKHNMILGHEASAEVVEVGSEVKDFKPGDKVIIPAITPDWQSVEAQNGFSQHSGAALGGWKFSNIKDGVFSEFFHVNEADGNLAHLPEGIDIEDAVMLSDMVPTGFHCANNAEVAYGETVVVIGIGAVGLMSLAGAVLRGAGRVYAVGSRSACVEAAKFYGATDIVNYRQGDIVEQILEAQHGKPVDKVLIAGGTVDTFDQAVRLVRPGGIVSNVNYLGTGDYIKIPREAWGLGMGHIRIIGGLMPGGRKNMDYLAQLLVTGRLSVKPLLTHHFQGFDQLEPALLLMKDKPGDLIKPVVKLV
ncbi:MAG: NAD(P)-dependent alcohol dehydrogenase [Coriobacteriales bacterium]|nr:NAD(P)-dependent alcohol dehydrogenase [Coriobacteriales bacterium]